MSRLDLRPPPAHSRRVLLLTTERWPTAALFACALADEGAAVAAIRPAGHPLEALREVRPAWSYRHLRRHALLDRAVRRFQPQLVIPCDDAAVAILHEHHARAAGRGDPARLALIEASLGEAAGFAVARRKSLFIAMAARLGVRTPESRSFSTRAELERLLAGRRWPVVLKADGWASGRGVRIVRCAEEAMAAFADLARAERLWPRLKDALVQNSLTPLDRPRIKGAPALTLQSYVQGRPANCAVAARDGQVLAIRTFEVLEAMSETGNATVVRVCEIPAVEEAARRCVAELRMSGIAGFDFIHDPETGLAWLLEMNPRVTAASYTAAAGGRSAAAVLVGGGDGVVAAQPTEGQAIALFPQELERDPASPWLRTAHHPAPWSEPRLVRRCIRDAVRTPLRRHLLTRRRRGDKNGPGSTAKP